MRIEDTCCCGAVFEAESKLPRPALDTHYEWMKQHAPCREANMIVMASKIKQPKENE